MQENDPLSVRDTIVESFADIERRLEAGITTDGIPTGFTDLDDLLGGLYRKELTVIAGRTSMGKTALMLDIARKFAVRDKLAGLIVSLEQPHIAVSQRLLCSQGHIDLEKFRNGFLGGEDRKGVVEAAGAIGSCPLFISDRRGQTIFDICSLVRQLKKDNDLAFMALDHLQLVFPDNSTDNLHEQLARMVRELHRLAYDLDIIVLCCSQLNRGLFADTGDRRPKLHHLRQSGAIEDTADVVLFVHREEYYLSREQAEEQGVRGLAEIIVAKQRNGPIGAVKLDWNENQTTFSTHVEKAYEGFSNEF